MDAMPSSIHWGRTQTIGMGAECCDFKWDYVPVIIWYDLVNDSELHPDDREGYFGLFDFDLNWKPSAKAFQKASEKFLN